jgi:hypothetical protein
VHDADRETLALPPDGKKARPMTTSPLVVRVEMRGKTLASAMSEVRTWLDDHKIQPAGFASEPGPDGVAFDIRFAREQEARLFEQAFV